MVRTLQITFGLILTTVVVLQLLLIYGIWLGAPVIEQAEVQVGHALTCDEAYAYRAIDSFFFPSHALAGNVVYITHLCSPLWLGLLLLIVSAGMVRQIRRRLGRWHWLLLGLTLALLVPILIYWPIVYKIACATE